MKTNRTARFVIDFVKKTITGSEASFKKASKGFGPEYEELTEKITKHPEFKLIVIEAKKSTKAKIPKPAVAIGSKGVLSSEGSIACSEATPKSSSAVPR